jgi:hypothetical protein
VLLGLVARKDGHLSGLAELASQDAAHQHLAERPGAAGDEDAPAL